VDDALPLHIIEAGEQVALVAHEGHLAVVE
jgi:hypothetical protein